jgi:glycosyltransferase involved in cell wall biosynthesis
MKKGISVIICTKNGQNRIIQTLYHLVQQKFNKDIQFEILIIDNNSDDSSVVKVVDFFSLYKHIQHKILIEHKNGKANALFTGVNNAQFSYLLICDDDNWLENNYLETVYDIFESDQNNVAIIGGIGIPVFDDHNFIYQGAILSGTGSQFNKPGLIKKPGFTFYGAGSAIRKELFDQIKKQNLKILVNGYSGKKAAGEDTEICYLASLLGYNFFYTEDLKFKHYYPTSRMNYVNSYLDDVSHAGTKFFLKFYQLIFRNKGRRKYFIYVYPFIEIYSTLVQILNEFKSHKQIYKGSRRRLRNAIMLISFFYYNFKYFNKLNNMSLIINSNDNI